MRPPASNEGNESITLFDVFMLPALLFRLAQVALLLKTRSIEEIFSQGSYSKNGISRTQNELSEKRTRNAFLIQLRKKHRILTFMLVRVFHSSRCCLFRSLALWKICQKRGLPSQVVVGIAKIDGKIIGHCWLNLDGKPFQENEDKLKDYVVMIGSGLVETRRKESLSKNVPLE